MANHYGPTVAQRGDLIVTDCAKCGYAHLNPLPSEELVLARYFANEPYANDWLKKELAEYRAGLWDSAFAERVRWYPVGWRSLLDIGAGPGLFVDYCRKLNPRRQIFGVEPSLAARVAAPSSFCMVPTLQHLPDRAALPFDAGNISLVLEHVRHPLAFLQEARQYYRPGATATIIVPNEFNPLQRRLNGNWFVDPNHVNYFSGDSLTRLVTEAGFKVIHTGATFPMELFALAGLNYIGNDRLGQKLHQLRLRFEKYAGRLAWRMYTRLYQRWGIGREVMVVAEV